MTIGRTFVDRLVSLIPRGRQGDIAKKAGLRPETISRWRAGGADRTTLATVERVAEALGVDPWVLLRPDAATTIKRSGGDVVVAPIFTSAPLGDLTLVDQAELELWPVSGALWSDGAALVRAGDDGLAPEVSAGDVVLIDQNGAHDGPPAAVAVAEGGVIALRRVVQVDDNLALLATPPGESPRLTLVTEQTRILGRFRGIIWRPADR